MQTTAASTIAQQNAQLNAQSAQYQNNIRDIKSQTDDTVMSGAGSVLQDVVKIGQSAFNVNKEKKLKELAYAYEQEKAKGTFDYIDMNKENGEEYDFEKVQENVRKWKDTWMEENGGLIGKFIGKDVDSYMNSLDAGIIEDTKTRSYNYVQKYNSENTAALTSVYTDYTDYNINNDIAIAFSEEGYFSLTDIRNVKEYGISDAVYRYMDAVQFGNEEEKMKATIDLRLAFAAKNTGESEESFNARKAEIIESVYHKANLAQFTRAWIDADGYGISDRYQKSGTDSDILDSAYDDFIKEVTNRGISLSDGTIIAADELSADDYAKLKSDFAEYGALVLSSAVKAQENAWDVSDEAYNEELTNGKVFMSIDEEVEFRVQSSGGTLSKAYAKKQIKKDSSKVTTYSTRSCITKLANAYTTLTKEWSPEELEGGEDSIAYKEKVKAAKAIQDLGMATFAKTSLGLGSDLVSPSDDTAIKDNEYMLSMLSWMRDNNSDLAHAIVANDGLSTASSGISTSKSSTSSSKSTGVSDTIASATSGTGDTGTSWVIDVKAEISDEKIDKFWDDITALKKQGYKDEELTEQMKALGYNVEDPTQPNYSLWSSYQTYSHFPVLDEYDDSAKELYRSVTKVQFKQGDNEDEDRINNNKATIMYSLQSDIYGVGYLLNHTAEYNSACSKAYATMMLSSKVNSYIQNGDYDGFCDFLETIGSTLQIGSTYFSEFKADENGKAKRDYSELVALIYDRFEEYSSDQYLGFTAENGDAELMTASGSLGKFDKVLENDVKETMTAFGQTYLQIYKYQNPDADIKNGIDGIKPTDATLYTMGTSSSTYKSFCSTLMTCKDDIERKAVLAEAKRSLTNEAYAELEKCKSIDLRLQASGFSCFNDTGVIKIAQSYLGDSDLSALLDNSEYNELQEYLATDEDFTKRLESKLLECQNNSSLDPYSEVYSIIGQAVQNFVVTRGVRAIEMEEGKLSYATKVDTRNDLAAIQKAVDEGDLTEKNNAISTALDNYEKNLETYRAYAGFGDTTVCSKITEILNPSNNSYLGEGMKNMLNIASTFGTSSEVKMNDDAEWILSLAIALNAWDTGYSYNLTTEDLSSANIAATKQTVGDWWSQLDSTKQVLVRDTAAAFGNVYGFYRDYNALDLGDTVKYENGTFVSDKFGVITRGSNGEFYYTNDKGEQVDLKMYSDKTPTSTIVDTEVHEIVYGTNIPRYEFTSETIESINNHNTQKDIINPSDNIGDQYVLVAVPNALVKDELGYDVNFNAFDSYDIKELKLDDAVELYKVYMNLQSNDYNDEIQKEFNDAFLTVDSFLSMLSDEQAQYVSGHAYEPLVSGAAEEITAEEITAEEITAEEMNEFIKEHPKASLGDIKNELIKCKNDTEFKDAVSILLDAVDKTDFLDEKTNGQAATYIKSIAEEIWNERHQESPYTENARRNERSDLKTIPMEEKIAQHNNTAAIGRREVEDTIDKELESLSNGGKDGLKVSNLTPLLSKYKENQSYLVKMLKKKFADGSLKLSVTAENFAIEEYGSIDEFLDYLAGNVEKRTTEK